MALLLQEFTRFIWRMQYKRWVAADLWTKPNQYEPQIRLNWQLWWLHSQSPFITTQPESWYSLTHRG